MPRSKLAAHISPLMLPEPSRDLFERYARHRRATRAATTWVKNRGNVVRWLLFLSQRGTHPAEARATDAQDFLAQWEDWGWSPLTKRSAVADLRTMHEWMIDADLTLTGRNPWRSMHLPRRPKRIPRIPTADDLQALDRAVRRPCTRDLRDRALLHFLRSSGCRVGECSAMNLVDLNLSDRTWIVRGKGDKERVGYFDQEAADALLLWIAHPLGRAEWTKSEAGPVFVGRHGARINKSAIYDALLRAKHRSGIGRHIHPHILRHAAGSAMYGTTHDIVATKDFLGHADLSTVMTYVHMDQSHVRAAYERTFGPQAAN